VDVRCLHLWQLQVLLCLWSSKAGRSRVPEWRDSLQEARFMYAFSLRSLSWLLIHVFSFFYVLVFANHSDIQRELSTQVKFKGFRADFNSLV
jgi:hypothetical protein